MANGFKAEGSDLLMGVGPAYTSRAGASVASVNDIYSIYWNPAGLARNTGLEFSISRQLDAQLETINFIGMSRLHELPLPSRPRLAYALAWLPRLHVSSNGHFSSDSFENLFLRFALPEVPEDFNGESLSKTRDYRFSIALSSSQNQRWAIGISVGVVRCVSHLCGATVSAPDLNYEANTEATAIAANIGLQYQLNEQLRFGAVFRDINTRLNVKTRVIHGEETRNEDFTTNFPRDLSAGVAWEVSDALVLNSDYQYLGGLYGQYSINLQLWRSAIEYSVSNWRLRGGLLLPIKLDIGLQSGLDKQLPAPFLVSSGFGWQFHTFKIDLSLYPNPISSYQKRQVVWSLEAAIGVTL